MSTVARVAAISKMVSSLVVVWGGGGGGDGDDGVDAAFDVNESEIMHFKRNYRFITIRKLLVIFFVFSIPKDTRKRVPADDSRLPNLPNAFLTLQLPRFEICSSPTNESSKKKLWN